MALFGLLLKRVGVVDAVSQKKLSKLLMGAVLPVNILSSANNPLSPELVGGMSVPISMILIGASMSEVKWQEIWSDRTVYMVSVLRLLVFPLVMLVVLSPFCLPPLVVASCIVITALSSGTINVVLAEQYDCDPNYAARTVVQTMILFLLTIPVILWSIERWVS